MAMHRLASLTILALALMAQPSCSGDAGLAGNGAKKSKADDKGKGSTDDPTKDKGSSEVPGTGKGTPDDPLILATGSKKDVADLLPPGAKVETGTSDNEKVATFDPKTGEITAVGVGEATIKIKTETGEEKEIVVKVVNPPGETSDDELPDVGSEVGEGFTDNPELLGLEPAVIVNKPACVTCHAQIKGSLITDFDHVKRPMSGRTGGLAFKPDGTLLTFSSVLSDADSLRPLSFRSMNLDGAFVIPKISIDGGDFLAAFKAKGFKGASVPLDDALKLPQFAVDGPEAYEAKDIGPVAIQMVGANRDKSKPGINELRSVSSITIAPPTEAEIKGLVGQSKGEVLAEGETKVLKLTESSQIEGLAIQAGASGPFVTNKGALTCKGDILVLGTLVLSEAGDVNVTGKSCRLYVSGTIFVKGAVNAGGSGVVQLASGRAISLGIRDSRTVVGSPEMLAERVNVYDFIEDSGVAFVLRMKGDSKRVVATTAFAWNFATPTKLPPTTPAEIDAAKAKYANFNSADVWKRVGAETPSPYGCTFDAGDGKGPLNPDSNCEYFTRGVETQYGKKREVSYNGVLLAAPEIHGRYHGKITGVVVATLAVFALADFQFEADARFKTVPILPALGRKLVDIK